MHLTVPPQPTGYFQLIHPLDTAPLVKPSLLSCLRDLAKKYGKRLTEDHAVI